jgi:elongation of very long chain fatty acids protein 6
MTEYLINAYTAFSEWERTFNGRDLAATMLEYNNAPFYAVGLYLVMLFPGQQWMKSRKPFNLKALFIVWNLFLAVFSFFGAYNAVPKFVEVISANGFRNTICGESFQWWYVGAEGAWMGLFSLSKVPELVDTVFLVFQKKPVIFLHWYHHITVMLYCWFAYSLFSSISMWFATMNYVVHSIMYTYYFLTSVSSFTRGLVRPFALFITSLQIAQMVAGLILVAVVQYFFSQESGCPGANQTANYAALVMYSSYFVLFAQFFLHSYVWKSGKKRSKDD